MGCCFYNDFGCSDLMLRKAWRSALFLNILVCNTQIYNLISGPQITRLLLGDAIILSKTFKCTFKCLKYGNLLNLPRVFLGYPLYVLLASGKNVVFFCVFLF